MSCQITCTLSTTKLVVVVRTQAGGCGSRGNKSNGPSVGGRKNVAVGAPTDAGMGRAFFWEQFDMQGNCFDRYHCTVSSCWLGNLV
uniref:Uncharacterized protein n=1 Tax=Arundo donax TaxID=35708 RepID=A0A0A9DE36_ARUDO